MLGLSKDMVKVCRTGMLVKEMGISRLMEYEQHIKEEEIIGKREKQ